MKIDRARFLLLTAAIGSAAACTITSSNDVANDGGTEDAGSTADATGNVDARTDAANNDAGDATATTDAGTDGSTGDGSTGDGSTGDGATGDGSTGDGATGDAAPACNNDLALTDAGTAGFTCPTGEDSVGCLSAFQCDELKTLTRQSPQDRLLGCLAAADENSCFGTAGENFRCLAETQTATCEDDTVAVGVTCTAARALCSADGGVALIGCEDYVVMLSTEGRRQFTSCVAESNCDADTIRGCAFIYTGDL